MPFPNACETQRTLSKNMQIFVSPGDQIIRNNSTNTIKMFRDNFDSSHNNNCRREEMFH